MMERGLPLHSQVFLDHSIERLGLGLTIFVGMVTLWVVSPDTVFDQMGSESKPGLAILAVMTRIPDAIDDISEEQAQISNERDAFEEFAQRVASFQPTESHLSAFSAQQQQNPNLGVATMVQNGNSLSTNQLTNVTDAYQETVMALSHYESVYGEPLPENMSKELGPEVAQSVIAGDVLTSNLQSTLYTKSLRAAKERADFLHHLQTERESVQTARQKLRDIHNAVAEIDDSLYPRPISEVVQSWNRLEDLESECKSVFITRQSAIQSTPGSGNHHFLQNYLYHSRGWTFPVLGDSLDVLEQIQETKRRVCETIYEW